MTARVDARLALAVAVVSFDTRDVLERCLLSVRAAHPAQTVVVDNGSTDGSIELVRERFPEMTSIVNERNRGYGAAANQAIAACAAPGVLLLNSDTVLAPDALTALGRYLAEHPAAGIAGPRLANADGSLQRVDARLSVGRRHAHRRDGTAPARAAHAAACASASCARGRTTRRAPVPWLRGAALAIRRSAFDAVGGFDEDYFMYFEEVDLSRRLHAAGFADALRAGHDRAPRPRGEHRASTPARCGASGSSASGATCAATSRRARRRAARGCCARSRWRARAATRCGCGVARDPERRRALQAALACSGRAAGRARAVDAVRRRLAARDAVSRRPPAGATAARASSHGLAGELSRRHDVALLHLDARRDRSRDRRALRARARRRAAGPRPAGASAPAAPPPFVRGRSLKAAASACRDLRRRVRELARSFDAHVVQVETGVLGDALAGAPRALRVVTFYEPAGVAAREPRPAPGGLPFAHRLDALAAQREERRVLGLADAAVVFTERDRAAARAAARAGAASS